MFALYNTSDEVQVVSKPEAEGQKGPEPEPGHGGDGLQSDLELDSEGSQNLAR